MFGESQKEVKNAVLTGDRKERNQVGESEKGERPVALETSCLHLKNWFFFIKDGNDVHTQRDVMTTQL